MHPYSLCNDITEALHSSRLVARLDGFLYVLLGIVIGILVIIVAISICFAVVVKKGVDKAEEVGLINTETHTGSIGSSLEVGNNLEMTVYSAEKYVDPSGQIVGGTPKDGYYFLVLDVGFVNNGKETESVSSLMEMTVKDSAGREYDPTYLIHKTPSLPEGDIAVGEKTRGYVAFEIPVGTTSGPTPQTCP